MCCVSPRLIHVLFYFGCTLNLDGLRRVAGPLKNNLMGIAGNVFERRDLFFSISKFDYPVRFRVVCMLLERKRKKQPWNKSVVG